MKNLLGIILSLLLFTQLYSQSKSEIKLNDGEVIEAYDLKDSETSLSYKIYYTNNGKVSDNLTFRSVQKSRVNYYTSGPDTIYCNFIIDGIVYDKETALEKVMLETDPKSYYQNIGYSKLKSGGKKLVLSTIISVAGSIVSTKLTSEGEYQAAIGLSVGTGLTSLILLVSSGVDLIKSSKNLNKTIEYKENYYYNDVPLK